MSYLVPTEEISLANQERLRNGAEYAGKQTLLNKSQVPIADAVARDADYVIDFITPAAPAAVAGLAGWLSAPFAAAATPYSLFATNVPAALATITVPHNQVWVFYKVNIITLNDPATMLFFTIGSSANRKAQFDLECLYTKLCTDGYFSQPVVYAKQDVVGITARSRLALGAAVGARIRLGCLIIENLQNTVV